MLGKRVAPVIGKLTRPAVSNSNRTEMVGVATSPRSPLDIKIIHSPRGIKNYDVGGVGLGIVAALEKSLDVGCEIHGNNNKAVTTNMCSRNLNRSNPIPVNSVKRESGDFDESEMESLEEYTFVTRRRPGNKSYTRVYYGGVERSTSRKGDERTEFDRRSSKMERHSVFAISPAKFGESVAVSPSDFLSSCHLCKKKLQGKDIYMYRENAFCSTECRYRQIVTDEYKEKCSTEVSKSSDISSSPCKNDQLFAPGILAI